jgi:hypothetical protein
LFHSKKDKHFVMNVMYWFQDHLQMLINDIIPKLKVMVTTIAGSYSVSSTVDWKFWYKCFRTKFFTIRFRHWQWKFFWKIFGWVWINLRILDSLWIGRPVQL